VARVDASCEFGIWHIQNGYSRPKDDVNELASQRNLNIYCDESSHLENDRQPVMGLGAIICPNGRVRDLARQIRDLKRSSGIPERQELKWVGVSPSNLHLYREVVRLFFASDELRFRVVVAGKRGLDHAAHSQTHDEWYYKMYFMMLTTILEQKNKHEIYLDVKDTLGAGKVRKLRRVLCNAMWDFNEEAITRIELIRSHESALLQLADVLTGAVCYLSREGTTSVAKRTLIGDIQRESGFTLKRTTSSAEQKFNIFYWTGAQA
jgi:hypothetical protein